MSGNAEVTASGNPDRGVTAQDEKVTQATIAQLGQHREPELRPLGLGDPHAQSMLATLHVHPDDQVRDLDRHHASVPDLDPQPVDVDDRVHLVDRPVTPDLDLIGHHIGDLRDQLPGRSHALHLKQMRLDVAGRHPAGVERQDQLVDLPEPPRPFRHDPRLEHGRSGHAARRS